MYSFLSKNGQTIAFLAGVGIVAIFLIMALSGDTSAIDSDSFLGLQEDELKAKLTPVSNFDFGFNATFALFGIGAVLAIVLPLIYMVTNFSKEYLIGIAGVVVIVAMFFIFTNMSKSEVDTYAVKVAMENLEVSQDQGWMVSGGIKTSIALMVLSAVSLIVAELYNVIK